MIAGLKRGSAEEQFTRVQARGTTMKSFWQEKRMTDGYRIVPGLERRCWRSFTEAGYVYVYYCPNPDSLDLN